VAHLPHNDLGKDRWPATAIGRRTARVWAFEIGPSPTHQKGRAGTFLVSVRKARRWTGARALRSVPKNGTGGNCGRGKVTGTGLNVDLFENHYHADGPAYAAHRYQASQSARSDTIIGTGGRGPRESAPPLFGTCRRCASPGDLAEKSKETRDVGAGGRDAERRHRHSGDILAGKKSSTTEIRASRSAFLARKFECRSDGRSGDRRNRFATRPLVALTASRRRGRRGGRPYRIRSPNFQWRANAIQKTSRS